jgi:hypothetical protein
VGSSSSWPEQDPFPHHSDYSEFVRAVVEDEERPPLPADCPGHLRQLIESCWDAYPENRPDFEEINAVMDEIIIEAAITELSACRFWIHYFIKEVQQLRSEGVLCVALTVLGISSW